MSLDAVILAGGKSERLRGIVPPYHKPFLVINGRSLLVAAVEDAIVIGAERVIVVATAENALPVAQLVGHHTNVRIVLSAGGPGQALHTGLEMCVYQRVLVLMSDNVFAVDDIKRCCEPRYSIGVRYVTCTEAQRFTRFEYGEWVEGPGNTSDCTTDDPHRMIWCGPLVIQRQRGLDLLAGQERIGPFIGNLMPTVELVDVETVDAGTPEVVRELTKE